jgi:hypothetical protein
MTGHVHLMYHSYPDQPAHKRFACELIWIDKNRNDVDCTIWGYGVSFPDAKADAILKFQSLPQPEIIEVV